MTHVCHRYQTASDISMAKMCAYPPSQNEFPHWKGVFRCCDNSPSIDLTIKESDRHHSNISPTIIFHVYHLFSHCTVHGRCSLDKKNCPLLLCGTSSVTPAKLYTITELIKMDI